jgi:hypothetical protein
MNTQPLPRTSAASRFNALIAAVAVTLAMLSAIDHLASAESAAALVAQGAQSSAAGPGA